MMIIVRKVSHMKAIPIEVIKERIEELKMFREECRGGEYASKLWCTSRINALQELLEDYEEEE